jgi:hypothetical protein
VADVMSGPSRLQNKAAACRVWRPFSLATPW